METARKRRVATHVTDYVSTVGESLSRDPTALTCIDTHRTIKPAIKYETAQLEERSLGRRAPDNFIKPLVWRFPRKEWHVYWRARMSHVTEFLTDDLYSVLTNDSISLMN